MALRERIRASVAAAAQAAPALPSPVPEEPATHSSLPPEHSGVRSRPNEPEPASTLPPPVFLPPPVTASRPTPRAWPLAPPLGKTPGRRALAATQMGLGVPPAKGSVPPPPLGAEDARGRTPALPRAAISSDVRQPQPGQGDAPAPSVSDDEAAQLHASAAITQPIKIPNEARSAILAGGELDANAAAAADAELTRRAFAATDMVVLPSPKSADGEPSAEPQGASDWSPGTTKPQRKLLNASKPGSEAGRYSVQGSTVDYVESNTASKPAGVWSSARPSDPEPSGSWGVVPDPNATWGATADASDAGASWNPAPDEDPNARARRYTPKQRPAQRGRRAPTIRGQGDRPESMTTLPDRPRSPAALRSTVPGRPALARPSPLPAAPVASLPSSVRVDPSASIPSPPAPQRTAAGRPASPANYEPLPRDRESFEAYMRNKRAAETSPPHARSNWKEQETLLIPRDSLPPEATRESLLGRMPWMRVAAVLAVVLMGSLAYWLRQTAPGGGPGPTLHSESPPQTERQSAPAAVMTLIATEPSGAELLLGGAVLGNTPFAVPRPTQGDETYLLRLRGFESQLVRLSPQSAGAIRVSLVPQATPTPASR